MVQHLDQGQLTRDPSGLAKRMATVVSAEPECVVSTSARWRAIQMPLPRRASVLGRWSPVVAGMLIRP